MRSKLVPQLVMLAALAGAACEPSEVPDRPSWDQDVFPILQGSCNHCHGTTVGKNLPGPIGRLDVCSPAQYSSLGVTVPGLLGASAESGAFNDYINAKMGKPRAAMPPAPAPELRQYEKDVLIKWAKLVPSAGAAACAKQTRNREPKAVLVSQTINEDDELVVTIETSDPDGDQVLGKVTVGGSDKIILGAGRFDHVFPGQAMDAAVKVTIHDGYVASPIVVDF